MRRLALILAALWLAGCTLSHPLGEGFETLDEVGKDQRAVEALREVFATRINASGGRLADRDVASCTTQTIVYTWLGSTTTLRWRDLESLESQTDDTVPARPETVRLYIRDGSPSVFTTPDRVRPLLESTGLVRSYLELRDRPRWSANRMRAALAQIHRRKAPGLRPAATPTPESADSSVEAATPTETTAPVTEDPAAGKPDAAPSQTPEADDALDAIEAKLRRLKQWLADGLISEADYEAKRQELLKGL